MHKGQKDVRLNCLLKGDLRWVKCKLVKSEVMFRYRIEQLEIGQSITVSNNDSEERSKFKDRVRQSASHAGRKLKRLHTVRWTGDTEVTIWRIS